MSNGLSIAYRNLESSDAIEDHVRRRFSDLDKLEAKIESCHVVIEAGQRQTSGREFTVRLKIAVPGRISRSNVRSAAASRPRISIWPSTRHLMPPAG